MGHQYITFAFQNRSSVACSMFGFPGVQLLDAHGSPLSTRVGHAYFDTGPARRVLLQPFGYGFFTLAETLIPSASDPQPCPRATLAVTPPGQRQALTSPQAITPCGGRVTVTPVRSTGELDPACAPLPGPGWGTGLQLRSSSSSAPVYLVRAGRQECSDRVVFHLNGPDPVGYSVRYVDVVREDGSGRPVPVAGGAALQVVINAPALGQDSHGVVDKVLAEPGADFYTPAQLGGWSSLREVRYAGSFEGQTTIAVGVRAQVPFRVFTVLDRSGLYRSVVLDLAP